MSKEFYVILMLILLFFRTANGDDNHYVPVPVNEGDCSYLIKQKSVKHVQSISWSGDCHKGKVNGNGELVVYFKKDDSGIAYTYSGEFKNGHRHGIVELIRPEGTVLSGKYKKGEIEHPYRFIHKDGTVKEVLKEEDFVRQVRISYADGAKYEGAEKEGKYSGKGKLTDTNGDSWEGTWRNGKKHGKGKFTFADGGSYEGLWENDERIKIFD